MKKTGSKIIGVFAAIAAVVVLASSIVVTYPNEYKLIKQFGEIVDVVEAPGVSFKIPFIQESASVPKELQIYDIPKSDVITKDKKSMIADAFVLEDFGSRIIHKTFKRSGSAGPVQNFGFCLLIDEVGHLQYGSG